MTSNTTKLPNGLRVHHMNLPETLALYQEVFEEGVYAQSGIRLADGCCVLDIGANIGLFSLYIHDKFRNARVFAAEPVPPTRNQLTRNIQDYGVNVTVWPFAISDCSGDGEVTFYPKMSGNSGLYPEPETERHVTQTFLDNLAPGEKAFQAIVLEGKFEAEKHACEKKTISQLIDACNIEHIDLIKIDVEKSELDVINGIEARHFPIIDQLVLEVHQIEDRTEKITARLKSAGFEVSVTQCPTLRNTGLFQLYAIKKGLGLREPKTADVCLLPREVESHQPDKNILPSAFSNTEREVVGIWEQLLNSKIENNKVNFFDQGGHSLMAILMAAKIYEKFRIELPLSDLFEHATVERLAHYLERQSSPAPALL